MYIRQHVFCTNTYVHAQIRAYKRGHIRAWTYPCTHKHTCTHRHTYTHNAHLFVQTCSRTQLHVNSHANIHTCTAADPPIRGTCCKWISCTNIFKEAYTFYPTSCHSTQIQFLWHVHICTGNITTRFSPRPSPQLPITEKSRSLLVRLLLLLDELGCTSKGVLPSRPVCARVMRVWLQASPTGSDQSNEVIEGLYWTYLERGVLENTSIFSFNGAFFWSQTFKITAAARTEYIAILNCAQYCVK